MLGINTIQVKNANFTLKISGKRVFNVPRTDITITSHKAKVTSKRHKMKVCLYI